MSAKKYIFIVYMFFFFAQSTHCYNLPYINLGLTSFLDGGPLRPVPGWYFINLFEYYQSHTFLDAHGCLLDGIPSPHLKEFTYLPIVVYQWERKILGASPGADVTIPFALINKITCSGLGLTTSGGGMGDLFGGAYLQWDAIMHGDRPIFVHRLEFDVSFPTGKVHSPVATTINPGNNFFFINPYWAATLYPISRLSISWRIFYLWSALNRATCIQPGDAVHLNYAVAYEVVKNFHIGINGYFLQQIKDDKLHGMPILQSRERIFAVGPGAIYVQSQDLYILGNFYKESHARNRTQGIKAVFTVIKHF